MWKCDRLWASDYLESRNVTSSFMTLSCDGWIFGIIWLVDASFLKRKFFFFLYSLYLSILRTKVIMIGCFGDEALFISSHFVIYLFYKLHFVTILADIQQRRDYQHFGKSHTECCCSVWCLLQVVSWETLKRMFRKKEVLKTVKIVNSLLSCCQLACRRLWLCFVVILSRFSFFV